MSTLVVAGVPESLALASPSLGLAAPSMALRALRPGMDTRVLRAMLTNVRPAESFDHIMRCLLHKPPHEWEFWFVLADRKVVGLFGYQVRTTDVCVRFLSLLSSVRDPQTYRVLLNFLKDRYQPGNVRTQGPRAVTVLLPERDCQAQVFLRTLGYRCMEQYIPGKITKQFPQGVPSVFGTQTCYLFREPPVIVGGVADELSKLEGNV